MAFGTFKSLTELVRAKQNPATERKEKACVQGLGLWWLTKCSQESEHTVNMEGGTDLGSPQSSRGSRGEPVYVGWIALDWLFFSWKQDSLETLLKAGAQSPHKVMLCVLFSGLPGQTPGSRAGETGWTQLPFPDSG